MKPIGAGNLHPYIFQAIRNHIFLSFFICFPLLCHGAEEALFISEFMADGNRTLADEDGEYPDWIELFNSGVDTVNLNGWHLTDDPGNLTKWTFPDIDLPAGRCLLVFASGKDRANADSPLHTNFRLEIEGEYLALLKPGGQTIVHEYAPYPSQNVPKDGYSYGLRTHAVSFLSNGAPVRVHVPEAADSGDSWTSPSFDDSSWQAAELGVGFGTLSGKLAATLYEANMTVDSLSAADRVIADKSLQKRVVFEETNVINYFDNDEDGHFIDNSPFPGHQTNENIDDFVLLATGVIIIPESGTWTFGINSDDGARLRIDDRDVIVDDTTHAVQDALASISLTAGRHTIELVYFERSGGAELELFAAKGQYSSFQSRRFNLVGDEENGGIGLEGFSSLIHYDARDVMAGKNASIFLRIPFEVDDPSLHYNLVLRMRYNDGFAAYINGREIARRNAPDPLDWNSAALEERPFSDSLAVAELNLPDSSNLLQDGTNILAIHGLNYAPADENFLIQAELTGSIIFADDPRYFMPPTPGSQNGAGVSGFVEDVVFSQDHGFYDEPFTVTLATQTENAAIRYTTDCTDPTESNGTLYTGPITIDRLTPLRAAAFKPGFEPSRISTQTYIFLDDVLQQVRPEGYPSAWGNNVSADYGMDPDVINDPRYRDTIRDDLQSLPVMSLVSEPDYFFGSRDGIYTHPENKGIAWERPCSTEFFFPDGSREGFQVNNGIRIQGGYSRIPDRRKHSFRMLFKRDYGPPTLRCKMFDNSPVEKFDQLVLRGGYNYTWHSHEGGFGSNIARADYIRDEFSRRLELAVGKVGSHGRYVHLYLNGMYWGVYILCERPDDGFAAEYFGGEKEEYDVITSGTRNINTTQIKAGDKNAWNQLMALARAGGFQDIQKYEAIQEYVDIDYLIDYMMVIYLAGNRDAPTVIGGGGNPWNFYSNHRRVPGEGFRFFCWDSEWTLEEPDRNVVTFHTQGYEDPSFLFLKLRSSPEFMIRVADRIQKHFFNDGGLTPQSTMAIYSELAETLDRAIVGESARWGDVKGGSPKTRDDNWLPEINRILTTYLPVRTDIVVNQLHDFGLYPDIPAPEFSQCGGLVQSNFQLGMTLQDDLQQDKIETPLIKIDHVWKYDQSGIDPGSSWKDSDFDDSNWPSGKALLYVEGSNLSAPKNTPLTIGRTTYYFRSEFDIPANFDLSEAQIELNVFVDDGMIVYINDKEVFRIGMPDGAVDYETFANRTVTNANYEGPFTLAADSIKAGKNVIAVEVHQINATSSDIVMGLTLNAYTPPPDEDDTPIYYTLDGSDPRLAGGEVNAESALSYNSPIGITDNVTIKARTHLNGQWSALTEADFIIDSAESDASNVLTNLRITELMYNPSGGEEFEFIELHNTHPTSVLYLNGLGFTNGVEFVFPNGTSIPAGDYLLVAPSPGSMEQEAFRDHYGLDESIALAGPYSGKFSNGGERITLSDLRTGLEIISFEYNDGRGWPVQADGAGHSLVPKPSAMTNQMEGSLEYGGHWRASYALGGSPGAEDPEPPASLVINEIVANPPSGESDWIELYNTANATIHLGDWYLSDDEDNLAQWPIPSFEMAANTWISFDQQNDFDNPPGSGFGLSKDGESLYLSYLPGLDGVDRVVDAISFKAQDGDRALGRFSDGYPYFAATSPDTREQANIPAPASIVIDELMYQPNPANAADETMYEYIEIYNASDKTRSFFNENGVYRIDGGVQFEFPANLTLDAGKRLLIVGFDPSDASLSSLFKKQYGASDIDLHILGPYSGKLSNQGERIALEKPKSIDALTQNINWGIVDEVIYFNADPWPAEAAGAGQALQRDDAHRPGSDPANWRAAEPTLGGQPTSVRSWMLY